MHSIPEVRPEPFLFTLCYFRCEPASGSVREIAGYTISLRITDWLRPEYRLNVCTAGWRPIRSFPFRDHEYVLNAAEAYFGIRKAQWIACHPLRGIALYGRPRTGIERLHRRLVRAFDQERRADVPAFADLREAGTVFGVAAPACVRIGRFPRFGGGGFLWHAGTVDALAQGFGLPLGNFICLLCWDAGVVDDAQIDAVIHRLSVLGAVGFGCQGEGAGRVCQRIQALAERPDGQLMPAARAWHLAGSPAEAVAFLADKASPAECYLDRCSVAVAVVISCEPAMLATVRDAMLDKARETSIF